MDESIAKLDQLIKEAGKILIVQADNPDGDSLASSLALEQIFGEMGKDTYMYCSVKVADYWKNLDGWDRVEQHMPSQFDVAVMVDNGYQRLLGNLTKSGEISLLKSKPFIILDHHSSETDIEFADVYINDPKQASTGQVIYTLATKLGWPLDKTSSSMITSSILSDSLGLTSEVMRENPQTLIVLAELVKNGVDLSELNAKRLESMKIDKTMVAYKGQLMQRIEFVDDGAIATITISHEELKERSGDYNPTVILDEMRSVRGVKISIGFKLYDHGGKTYKITARIRCNRGYSIAKDLAENYDGGGHPYASGIKWEDSNGLDFDKIKQDVLTKASELLIQADETI